MTTFGLYGARLSLAVRRHFTCYIFFCLYLLLCTVSEKYIYYTILLLYYYPNVFAFVFNFINFSLVVAASFMAEKPNVGVAIFVADNIYMCGFGSDGAAALLSACSLVRCGSRQFVSTVLRCCFRALLHFVRSAARPSQDIVSMSTAYSSPMPAHHRGCLSECDHPPYSGHEATIELSLLPGIRNSSLPAIQQCATNTDTVDRHLCLHRQLGACQHSSRETSES